MAYVYNGGAASGGAPFPCQILSARKGLPKLLDGLA